MKKVFNLKHVSGSKKMNKGTCLYAVAQRAQRRMLRWSTGPALMVLAGLCFGCSAGGRLSWVNP